MTEAVEQLKTQLGTLSTAERAELASYLLATLEPEEAGVEPEEPGVKEAWQIEVARRLSEARAGRVKGRPVDEVLAELRELYP